AEWGPRVATSLERRERVGLADFGAEVRLAVEGEMAVTVDHPRHHECAGRRCYFGALAVRRPWDRAPLTDPHDLAAIDDDRRVCHRSRAIEEAVDLEDSPHPAGQYRPPMPNALIDRLRARGFVPPDYEGGGLLNVAATVLDVLGVRDDTDPPPLRALEPSLRDGVRQVVLGRADGPGLAQLRALCAAGDMPFVASIVERATRHYRAQLIEATTIFPSTTAAAITTLHTARTPQEHGNLAYFVCPQEFAQVTQMLRWGPAVHRRGSYFDDPRVEPRVYVRVGWIYPRLPGRAVAAAILPPEPFRREAVAPRARRQ